MYPILKTFTLVWMFLSKQLLNKTENWLKRALYFVLDDYASS